MTAGLYLTLQTTRNNGPPELDGDNQKVQQARHGRNQDETASNPRVQRSLWVVIDATDPDCDLTVHPLKRSAVDRNVVIVFSGDNNRAPWCRPPNCFLLTPNHCRQTPLKSWATSSLRHCPSRLTGYLYALSNGATKIVDVPCDKMSLTRMDGGLLGLCERGSMDGLLYNSTSRFSPKDYISSVSVVDVNCPKFIPSGSNNSKNTLKYLVERFDNVEALQIVPFIQEGQLVQDKRESDFLYSLPLVVTASTALAPLTNGIVCFGGLEMFLMFVPPGVPVWFSALFRTLWLHVVRQHRPLRVGFLPVGTKLGSGAGRGDRCPGSHDDSFEEALADKQVVACARKSRCAEARWSRLCAVELALQVFSCLDRLAENVHLNTSHLLDALTSWVDDLLLITKDTFDSNYDTSSKDHELSKNTVTINMGNRRLICQNSTQLFHSGIGSFIAQYIKSICPNLQVQMGTIHFRWTHPAISDIALVIYVDDKNLSDSLPYLEYLHRQYFSRIFYCDATGGAALDDLTTRLHLDYITYICAGSRDHTNFYTCLSHAMKLDLPVSGYLLIHQNVLLNSWKLWDLPRDFIWMPQGFSKRNVYKTKSLDRWIKWNEQSERLAQVKIFSQLHDEALTNNRSDESQNMKTFAQNFLNTFFENLQTDYILSGNVHFFYIPATLRGQFITIAEKCSLANATTNIAVPIIHFGLTKAERVLYLPASSLAGENSKQPWNYFSSYDSYAVHPFGPNVHLKSTKGRKFFCKVYLRQHDSHI